MPLQTITLNKGKFPSNWFKEAHCNEWTRSLCLIQRWSINILLKMSLILRTKTYQVDFKVMTLKKIGRTSGLIERWPIGHFSKISSTSKEKYIKPLFKIGPFNHIKKYAQLQKEGLWASFEDTQLKERTRPSRLFKDARSTKDTPWWPIESCSRMAQRIFKGSDPCGHWWPPPIPLAQNMISILVVFIRFFRSWTSRDFF